jgi:hypothetical protein
MSSLEHTFPRVDTPSISRRALSRAVRVVHWDYRRVPLFWHLNDLVLYTPFTPE